MKEYPKIQSVFKRDENTHRFIEGEFSLPEFEYLQNNIWVCTEKVDGTNIRVIWTGEEVEFKGKTDRAQIPVFLLERLQQIFPTDDLADIWGDWNTNKGEMPGICLYGEGYGARIQKGGGNYIPAGVDFVLFDVWVDGWWLKREDIEDVAAKLELEVVPILGEWTLPEAIGYTRSPIKSEWGDFHAEGLVCKPKVDLFARNGKRIITKMKTKDFA